MRGIWLWAASAFLWFVAIYDIPKLALTTDLIGLGTLVIGTIPLAVYRIKYKSAFYREPKEAFDPTGGVSETLAKAGQM